MSVIENDGAPPTIPQFEQWPYAHACVVLWYMPPETVHVNERYVISLSCVFFCLFVYVYVYVLVYVCVFMCVCLCVCLQEGHLRPRQLHPASL
jgi:hypothetical protein